MAAAAFVVVLLRQPHTLTRPQFIWEETAAFWAASFVLDPLRYLLEPWAGYLTVVPRAVFLVARLGPPEVAPAVTVVLHAALIGLIAAFLASDRMAAAIPDRRVRLTFAFGIAVLPVAEPYVSILSAQWFLALFLAGLSRTASRPMDLLLVVVVGMSGIGAALTAPLFFVDWRRGRSVDPRGVILVAVLAAHGLAVLASGRQPRSLDIGPIVVGAVIALALVMAPRVRIPRPTLVAYGYLAIVTLALGTVAMGLSARYLLAASALALLVAAALLANWRPIGVAFALPVVVLIFAAFPIGPVADSRWADQARCIGGPTPCRVVVTPHEWSVDWAPAYTPPRGIDQLGMPVR